MAIGEAELKADFKLFLAHSWNYLRLPEPTKIQLDIADYLQHGPRRKMVKAFRGVGKSWLTADYALWRLYRDPLLNILIISASKKKADDFSTFCFQLLDLIPELEFLQPKNHQRAAKNAFDVGPAQANKDPSVTSLGITSMITGSRADICIPDDIEVPSNSATQIQRDKLRELVKEFDSVLKPGGEIDYLGTPQTEESLYNTLPERGYDVRVWPSRYPDRAQLVNYGDSLAPIIVQALKDNPKLVGKPTDPKRFSEQDLMEREASNGRSTFQLQYQLDTSLSDALRYPLKLADLMVMSLDQTRAPSKLAWGSGPEQIVNDLPNVGFNGDRFYRPIFIPKEDSSWAEYTGSVMAIDPAGQGKDETGIAVVKILNSMLFVHCLTGLHGGPTQVNLEKIAQLAKLHRVNVIRVEPNMGNGMYAQLLRPVVQRICTHQCSVEDDERSTGQKEPRIIDTLEPVLNQHRLIIDTKVIKDDYQSVQGLGSDNASRYQGLYQLTRITRDRGSLTHDDRVEALAMAVGYWTDQLSRSIDDAHRAHLDDLERQEDEEWSRDVLGSELVGHGNWIEDVR
jgi:hypothetical protein